MGSETIIAYFSGAGNSLSLARRLGKELDGSLLPIAAVRRQPFVSVNTNVLGLVFPVHAFGMPQIVEEFVHKLDLSSVSYVFAVTTCKVTSGATLLSLDRALKKKGSQLSAGFVIRMPGTAVDLYNVTPDAKCEKLFHTASQRVAEIRRVVLSESKHTDEQRLSFWRLLAPLLHPGFLKSLDTADRRFWVTEACDSCRVCAEVCPVDNITLKQGTPVWSGDCQKCFACIHMCPTKAIQYGKGTQKRGRYHHPEITPSDLKRQKVLSQ